MTDDELYSSGPSRRPAHAYAPYSNFHVGAALFLRDGRVVTGVNVENAVLSARDLRRARRARPRRRPRGRGRATSRRSRSRRRPAAAAASGCSSSGSSASSSCTRASSSTRTPAELLPGLLRAVRSGFVAVAGPAERRQVDARERALRRQGRDRLRQAADHAPPDLGRRERRGLPARARRPARASSARATR